MCAFIYLRGKNALNQLKKNTRSSSNDNVYLLLNNSSNEKSNLNELLSKRIKYSPAVVSGSSLNTQKEDLCKVKSSSSSYNQDTNRSETSTDEREKSHDPHKESKINKFIQYLTKSLDSNSNSSNNNSSNESLGNNKIQKQDSISISSLSSFNSNSSCSILNSSNFKSQNKRKKKDSSAKKIDQQPHQQQQQQKQMPLVAPPQNSNESPIIISVTGTSSPTINTATAASNYLDTNALNSKSSATVLKKNCSLKNLNPESVSQLNLLSNMFSLENDTVQHMQNLDINNDLTLKTKEKPNAVLDAGNGASGDSLALRKNSQSGWLAY